MKTNIFIPEKINVGFQNRSDTYTKKLAYVIYYDQKGVLRKEASWQSWRDKKIDNIIYDNAPISGFVLNKKAGGYSTGWNHRQTYCRVYDPRDFEFEITIPNLLYILENTNSIKGKGLEGEFVYGWDGTDLILIPTSSPDYIELTRFNETLYNPETIKGTDLVLGATYQTDKNQTWIYLGRFDEYNTWNGTNEGKKYFFKCEESYQTLKSLSKKIVKTIDKNPVTNYSELMEELEHEKIFSPIDTGKDEYIGYALDEFIHDCKNNYSDFYSKISGDMKYYTIYRHNYEGTTYDVRDNKNYCHIHSNDSLENIFDKMNPMYLRQYLKNGKIKKGDY